MVHPIFLEFVRFVEDEYWKLLYEDMAYNKFPHGVYLQTEHFCCFHKGKEYSVPIFSKKHDTFQLFTHVHSLLRNKLGIQSQSEKTSYKEQLLALQSVRDEVPKRMIKDSSLTSFVIREGKRHHLPDSVIRRLFSLFVIGFMFKTILMKDVVFDGNEIESVRGFVFSPRKIRITHNVLQLHRQQLLQDTPRTTDVVSTTMSSLWPKYLATLSV
jgi:hypothetical protein